MNKSITLFLLIVLLLNNNAQKRFHQPGNITIGVLLPLHSQTSIDTCGEFYNFGLGYAEAISYTIAQINKNASILRNVNLGIDVFDYCDSPRLAVAGAYMMVTNTILNYTLDAQTKKKRKFFRFDKVVSSPKVAFIGTEESSSTSFVASLLQVKLFD